MENINVYESADLIVQVSNLCDKNCSCPGCWVKRYEEIKELNLEIYKGCLRQLEENSLVVLLGGEITIIDDWFNKFITPALEKKLKIIIETDGYFIGKNDYKETLNKITHQNIFMRVGFDKKHIYNLNSVEIREEFDRMAIFANDAKGLGINFAFYSLGMDNKKILEFIKGTTLEPFGEYFYSLLYYKDISKVKLHREYLRADGKIFNYIKTD